MRETPSREVLESSSTPSIVLITSSSGLVMLVSTSSGDAPRNVVVTVTIGSSTSNRLIMVAKTGRLMQRSANPTPITSLAGGSALPLCSGGFSIGRLFDTHFNAIKQFCLARNGHQLTLF